LIRGPISWTWIEDGRIYIAKIGVSCILLSKPGVIVLTQICSDVGTVITVYALNPSVCFDIAAIDNWFGRIKGTLRWTWKRVRTAPAGLQSKTCGTRGYWPESFHHRPSGRVEEEIR
jgi:hypothetical protein